MYDTGMHTIVEIRNPAMAEGPLVAPLEFPMETARQIKGYMYELGTRPSEAKRPVLAIATSMPNLGRETLQLRFYEWKNGQLTAHRLPDKAFNKDCPHWDCAEDQKMPVAYFKPPCGNQGMAQCDAQPPMCAVGQTDGCECASSPNSPCGCHLMLDFQTEGNLITLDTADVDNDQRADLAVAASTDLPIAIYYFVPDLDFRPIARTDAAVGSTPRRRRRFSSSNSGVPTGCGAPPTPTSLSARRAVLSSSTPRRGRTARKRSRAWPRRALESWFRCAISGADTFTATPSRGRDRAMGSRTWSWSQRSLFGLNHNAIRQHLAKLVDAELVTEEHAPIVGRGRPRLNYRVHPAADSRWGATGPYERLSLLLSEMIRTGDSAEEVGRHAGRRQRLGADVDDDPIGAVVDAMERQGFEPTVRVRGDRVDVVLRTCPFETTALADPDTVCSIHLGMAQGIAELAGERLVVDELVPHDPRRANCRLRHARRN